MGESTTGHSSSQQYGPGLPLQRVVTAALLRRVGCKGADCRQRQVLKDLNFADKTIGIPDTGSHVRDFLFASHSCVGRLVRNWLSTVQQARGMCIEAALAWLEDAFRS